MAEIAHLIRRAEQRLQLRRIALSRRVFCAYAISNAVAHAGYSDGLCSCMPRKQSRNHNK